MTSTREKGVAFVVDDLELRLASSGVGGSSVFLVLSEELVENAIMSTDYNE